MTYQEIISAVTTLAPHEKLSLMQVLSLQLAPHFAEEAVQGTHSILDVPPAQLGGLLKPFNNEDDILGEMLEGRR